MPGCHLRQAVRNTKAASLLNVFKMTLAVLALALLSACSKTLQIEDGYCGVLVKSGKPVVGVCGPGVKQRPLLGIVVKFQKSKVIEININKDKPIKANVNVLDPVQFYKLSLGDYAGLAEYYRSRLKNTPREEAIDMILRDLNMPNTGIQVTIIQNDP